MKAKDFAGFAHVTVTEITAGCVRIEAEKGWRLKSVTTAETTNESGEKEAEETTAYTTKIYCRPDEELAEWEVVSEADGLSLDEARAALLEKIGEYDESAAVNSFGVAGQPYWLDKATRVALMNSATVSKGMGLQSVTLWLGGSPLELPTETAIGLLSKVEMYAQECFNVTQRHKAAAAALETAEDCVAYDYTAGYPERLDFPIEALGLA